MVASLVPEYLLIAAIADANGVISIGAVRLCDERREGIDAKVGILAEL